MPPRVTYWTGVWEPGREALSKEVAHLRRVLAPASPIVSFSAGQRSSLRVRDGVVRLSDRRWLLLRAAATAIEPWGDITHAVGNIDCWHFLRALGRRPMVLTAAIPGQTLDESLYAAVTMFVAESPRLVENLLRIGIARDRIRIIFPGVDLDEYVPAPMPAAPFRVLFGSTPASPEELEPRGVSLLVDVARQLPDVNFIFLWRQWGDRLATGRALSDLRLPSNVVVEHRDATRMAWEYRSAHATICCFAEGFGKSCPNSIIEGLACGRPAIVADTCGIADVIADHGAGVVAPRTAEALANAVRTLRARLCEHSLRARALAESTFDLKRFSAAYRAIYQEALARSPRLD